MNKKLSWAELAMTTPQQIVDGVNVYEGVINTTKVKQVVMTKIVNINFTSNCLVLPIQAIGTLTSTESSTPVMMGEIHFVEAGSVYTPSMAYTTFIIIGEGSIDA